MTNLPEETNDPTPHGEASDPYTGEQGVERPLWGAPPRHAVVPNEPPGQRVPPPDWPHESPSHDVIDDAATTGPLPLIGEPPQAPPQRRTVRNPGPPDSGPRLSAPPPGWVPQRVPPADQAHFRPPAARSHDDDSQIPARHRRPRAPRGWRRSTAAVTKGLINPGPSAKHEREELELDAIRAPLAGVAKVAVISLKGGVGKTSMTVGIGNTVATARGDRVIAVDVDPDLGDLDVSFSQAGGADANIERLAALTDAGRYSNIRFHTVQNVDRLEALGAQNDPRSSYILNATDYVSAIRILELHYNVILLDCGTGISTPLFAKIAAEVTGLVVVAAQDARGIRGARQTLHWLHAHGFDRLLSRTVVLTNATRPGKPTINLDDEEVYFRERVAKVVRIPYDRALNDGAAIELKSLAKPTRAKLTEAAAAIAEHFPARHPARHRFTDQGRF